MGYRRCWQGNGLSETVRLRHGSEWTYPSDRFQGGREYYFPYRALDCLSTTNGRQWPRAHAANGGGRPACEGARRDQHQDLAPPAQGDAFRRDTRLIADAPTHSLTRVQDHAIHHL